MYNVCSYVCMYVHAYVCIFTCTVCIYTSTYLHMYICLFLAKLTSMLTFKAMLKDERMVDEEAALRYVRTNVLTYVCVFIIYV